MAENEGSGHAGGVLVTGVDKVELDTILGELETGSKVTLKGDRRKAVMLLCRPISLVDSKSG